MADFETGGSGISASSESVASGLSRRSCAVCWSFCGSVRRTPFSSNSNGGQLADRSIHDLGQVRRFTVNAAVDAVAEILFDLRLHYAHRGDLRADGRQKILDIIALLEIEHAASAA